MIRKITIETSLLAVIAFTLLTLGATCAATKKPARSPAAAQRAAAEKAAAESLGVLGQGVQVFEPDPKRPGRYLWKMWAQAAAGAPLGSDKTYQVDVNGVTALLFQNGVPAATLKAPHARGNTTQQVVVATGRVVVTSLTEKGTLLKADTVTWYARQNHIVAQGHVYYRNGQNGMVLQGPILYGDTRLRTISTPRPGRITLPKGI